MERGWLIGTGVHLHGRNDFWYTTARQSNLSITEYFKIASRQEFECSQHREMVNIWPNRWSDDYTLYTCYEMSHRTPNVYNYYTHTHTHTHTHLLCWELNPGTCACRQMLYHWDIASASKCIFLKRKCRHFTLDNSSGPLHPCAYAFV
jgi:hypothetical protein